MKLLLFFLFVVLAFNSKAQPYFTASQFEGLVKSRFYFVGQSHNNKANTLIEQELLLLLHRTQGVRYDILEYAHSAAFLINHYLETGQDSVLDFINADANFSFIKTVRAYNLQLPSDKRIQFYGLDFEGRQGGRYTKKAVELILESANLPTHHPLLLLLRNTMGSTSFALKQNLNQLKAYLTNNRQDSRQLLGRYFIDVLLIASAPYAFSPKRDGAIFSNFKLLYNELASSGEQPKFFSSFGIGHINPDNRKGLARRLLQDEESPVRNQVGIIGVQYFNCQFGKQSVTKGSEGSLNFLCKADAVRSLVPQVNSEAVHYLPKAELSHLNCSKGMTYLAGVIVVQNFGATNHWTWE